MPIRPNIFIHAWFRSGSTYVWSKLREDASLKCYYEPLHEDIPTLDPAELEGQINTQEAASLNHPVPIRHYFFEYADLLRSGRLRHHPDISYRRYFLGEKDADPDLQNYITDLIGGADAEERTPVLCFCRSQMRAAWMQEHFSGLHIAQVRNPLSQWDSFIRRPYFTARLLTSSLVLLRRFPALATPVSNFKKIEDFFARGITQEMPLLTLPPQEMRYLFLLNWLVSTGQSLCHSSLLIDIDLLATSPAYQAKLGAYFAKKQIMVDFFDCRIDSTPLSHMRPEAEDVLNTAIALIRPLQEELYIDSRIIKPMISGLDVVSRFALRKFVG